MAAPKRTVSKSTSTRARRERRRRREAGQAGAHELTLRLDAELWGDVQELSKRTDRSASSLIRTAVRHYADHLRAPDVDAGEDPERPIARLRREGMV